MPKAPKRPTFDFYTKSGPTTSSGKTTTVKHVSFGGEDRRLSARTSYLAAPASPQKHGRLEDDDDDAHDHVDQLFDEASPACSFAEDLQDPAYLHYVEELSLENRPRKRTPADNTVEMWASGDVDRYLAELIRLDGRGDAVRDHCLQCIAGDADHRCVDCLGADLVCSSCIVLNHRGNPFHRIEHWNGTFFDRILLKSLGLRIQLGHPFFKPCIRPQRATNDDFCVLHVNGIHDVALDFCGCETATSETTQLLRFALFPATVVKPKTATSFSLLEYFQLLNFESKASAFEFFRAISRTTNNTGVSLPKDRYPAFMVMVREWRHLKLLKRAGRGHDPAGVMATAPGECAVLCPACPQPGKNLPDGWEDTPAVKRWLYALFLAIDANFRLQRKLVSTNERDPGLSKGWSYFVEEKKYREFLRERIDMPQEKSTCTSHNAVNQAETRSRRSLDSTGVGAVDCARHDMKRPCAVGDLQKGEKYVNMDYMVFSTLTFTTFLTLILSYDIVCQWYKNLWLRTSSYPHSIQLNRHGELVVVFLVPKFHLLAHVMACQTAFSFNLTLGVGSTDGEAPERAWSNLNRVANSTKEMGPGSRRDMLDDHFGDMNYKKVLSMGTTLMRRLKNAVAEANDHTVALEEFESSLEEDAGEVPKWEAQVQEWEAGNSTVNPYKTQVPTVTQNDVRLSIAQEEAAAALAAKNDGIIGAVHDSISPSVWITMGLDLEDQQRRLDFDTQHLGLHATSKQKATLLERSNSLQRKIDAWRQVQTIYIPGASVLRQRAERDIPYDAPEEQVPDMVLWLPSAVNRVVPVDPALETYEYRLRFAQGHDALNELRHLLSLHSHLYIKKDRFTRGVAANTRSRSIIKRTDDKVKAAAKKYRAAWAAVKILAKHLKKSGWELELPRLNDDDIRGMTAGLEGESEGRRTLSWIWKSAGVASQMKDNPAFHDSLRIEWCKSRARAMRWSEEVELLLEEMRRVLQFLTWHEAWWQSQGRRWDSLPDAQMEGLSAYAARQADHRRALQAEFSSIWQYASEWVDMHTCHADVSGLDRDERHDAALIPS